MSVDPEKFILQTREGGSWNGRDLEFHTHSKVAAKFKSALQKLQTKRGQDCKFVDLSSESGAIGGRGSRSLLASNEREVTDCVVSIETPLSRGRKTSKGTTGLLTIFGTGGIEDGTVDEAVDTNESGTSSGAGSKDEKDGSKTEEV